MFICFELMYMFNIGLNIKSRKLMYIYYFSININLNYLKNNLQFKQKVFEQLKDGRDK